MECRNCGRALDADARFCPGCGIASEATCVSCGAALEADARFCKRCGFGYRLYAVESLIDAALVAARANDADREPVLERAQAGIAELGYAPTLGPLPETHWVGVDVAAR